MAHVIVAGVRYEVPTELTIGESLDVASELGAASDTEIGRMVGLVWIAVRRKFPETTIADLRAQSYELYEDEADRIPPTSAAANGSEPDSETLTELEPTGTRGYSSTTESDLIR